MYGLYIRFVQIFDCEQRLIYPYLISQIDNIFLCQSAELTDTQAYKWYKQDSK